MTTEGSTTRPTDVILEAGSLDAAVRRVLAQPRDLLLSAEVVAALNDADSIIAAARAEAAQIREQSRQEGLAEALQRAVDLLDQAEAVRGQALDRAQKDVVTLAMATARKLIGRALEVEPELMSELVERSMGELRDARAVVVHVAPQHASAVQAARDRLVERAGDAEVVVKVDPTLASGDCVIDTELGRIDARLDIQFETIVNALLAAETT